MKAANLTASTTPHTSSNGRNAPWGRGLLLAVAVASMAGLFAAELFLGYDAVGHTLRSSVLGLGWGASMVLAGLSHPGEVRAARR